MLGFVVITTEIAKSFDMEEESAKKVRKIPGALAGTATAIGVAFLLGNTGRIGKKIIIIFLLTDNSEIYNVYVKTIVVTVG